MRVIIRRFSAEAVGDVPQIGIRCVSSVRIGALPYCIRVGFAEKRRLSSVV
jgi:hypothetical protein